jgi:hypothetical protein
MQGRNARWDVVLDFSQDERKQRAFLRVAHTMLGMWQEKDSSDTRLLLPPLVPEEYVLVGESLAGNEYSEHVVPRVAICRLCHDIFERSQAGTDLGVGEAAALIQRLLKIVRITRAEQQRIDHELRWKLCMPPGWDPVTGSPFARLDQAGIRYKLYP